MFKKYGKYYYPNYDEFAALTLSTMKFPPELTFGYDPRIMFFEDQLDQMEILLNKKDMLTSLNAYLVINKLTQFKYSNSSLKWEDFTPDGIPPRFSKKFLNISEYGEDSGHVAIVRVINTDLYLPGLIKLGIISKNEIKKFNYTPLNAMVFIDD